MIALLGPNGSGKTTLLRAICGELSHSGHVLLNGQDLTALSPKALAGLVSYIPQQSGISISMSALDVVLMGFYSRLKLFKQPSAKMRETALQALASVGLDDFANRDYLTLSGGEQQLVILARTLIEDTSLLLFDEPDSSLDFGNKYRMMGLIADIVQAAQLSLIHISRERQTARRAPKNAKSVVDGAAAETNRIAKAAPALAPEETPMRSGDASGFRKTVW